MHVWEITMFLIDIGNVLPAYLSIYLNSSVIYTIRTVANPPEQLPTHAETQTNTNEKKGSQSQQVFAFAFAAS